MAVNRINEFIECVKTSTDLKTLVEKELEYLDNNLVLSSKKRAISRYRNAIKVSLGLECEVLKSFKLTLDEIREFNHQKELQKDHDHTHLKPLDPINVTEKAIELLNTKGSYTKVAIALCLLTGRRSVEILKTAKFTYVSDDCILFDGQVKKGDLEVKPYPIPVLYDASEIIKALDYVRQVANFTELSNDAIHSRTNKTMNESAKKHFGSVIKGVSVKSLRSAYAEIISFWHKPDHISKAKFMAGVLGHSELDKSTAQSYEDFYIVD